jgi:hypothetical protein
VEQDGQISGGGGAGGGWDSIFENDQSAKVLSIETASNLFEYSNGITGAEWPDLKQIVSPCPTLKVITAVTSGMVQREELKRMREMGRPGMDGGVRKEVEVPKVTTSKKAALVADTVVSKVLGNTVGRVGRFVGKRVLGEVPEYAKTVRFYDENGVPIVDSKEESAVASPASISDLEGAISKQLEHDASEKAAVLVDKEDEALFRELSKKSDDSSRIAV